MAQRPLTVLLVGSGGREHALALALLSSPRLGRLLIAPGSDALRTLADCIPIAANDVKGLVDMATREAVDLVLCGPEGPLACGLADACHEAGVAVFAPTAAAAQIETSKAYAKALMTRANIPTASYTVARDRATLLSTLDRHAYPLVVKENGLCAGKGVTILGTKRDALSHAATLTVDDEHPVIVETYLEGFEFSLIVMAHGQRFVSLPLAQDHKAIHDGNTGPNTGGMGAVSPVPRVDDTLLKTVETTIIAPALRALADDGAPFTGFLYAGLMATAKGPYVVEFNARLGDPEAEVLLPRVSSDLLDALCTLLRGETPIVDVRPDACLGVVLAAPGYPGPITARPVLPDGLVAACEADSDLLLTHMGDALVNGRWQGQGGRLWMISALAPTIALAQERVYTLLDSAPFDVHYRRDIGRYAHSLATIDQVKGG